jgi:hypothetical protein
MLSIIRRRCRNAMSTTFVTHSLTAAAELLFIYQDLPLQLTSTFPHTAFLHVLQQHMMKFAITLFLFAYLVGASAKRGMATAYSGPGDMDATGRNACGFEQKKLSSRDRKFYAAMNEHDWKEAGGGDKVCGRCIAARGMKGHVAPGHEIKTVIVKIVDLCPEWACPRKEGNNVDFSTTALEAITG